MVPLTIFGILSEIGKVFLVIDGIMASLRYKHAPLVCSAMLFRWR